MLVPHESDQHAAAAATDCALQPPHGPHWAPLFTAATTIAPPALSICSPPSIVTRFSSRPACPWPRMSKHRREEAGTTPRLRCDAMRLFERLPHRHRRRRPPPAAPPTSASVRHPCGRTLARYWIERRISLLLPTTHLLPFARPPHEPAPLSRSLPPCSTPSTLHRARHVDRIVIHCTAIV